MPGIVIVQVWVIIVIIYSVTMSVAVDTPGWCVDCVVVAIILSLQWPGARAKSIMMFRRLNNSLMGTSA